MNEHADQLREAFEAHEYLAPDAATVYDRVQELARTYRRRRIGVQAAGGAVLGAGLIAGGLALPGGSRQVVVVQAPAAGGAAATTTPPSPAELQLELDAYFAAGYGYDDALKLAKIWHVAGNNQTIVKAEAGRRLLAGETLPIKPGPETGSGVETRQMRAVDEFFRAGYTYEDAEQLAALWKTVDPYHAKIKAGEKLLAGKKLPIAP